MNHTQPAASRAEAAALNPLLYLVRVALVTAWVLNAILATASLAQAWERGHIGPILGPAVLVVWIALLGWMGFRAIWPPSPRVNA